MLAKVLPSYLQFSEVREVLVVNDGSQDRTSEVLAAFADGDPRVKQLLHATNRGMTFARNTGVEHASANLILFSEDDLAPAPGSLTMLTDHLRATDADIIAGRRIWMRIGETETQALTRADSRRWAVVNRRLLEHNSHAITATDVASPLVNATMLMRRDVLEKVRYANCYPGNAWREESDFQLSAQALGFKVMFCPHSIFFHHDRAIAGRGSNRVKSDLVYLYWIYRNNLTFLRRHREYLSQEIPEALVLGNPLLTNLGYIVYRGVLLAQTEVRRAILSRSHGG